ncbi:hypothetical protein I302_106525 [Kwoniella bestiolae CBS 10118]|uniref:NmrA-like domain-containing protein n=1 Tax=Kwoniella bestiolae CBS 10118 TaxID=1296100 RepID=A0A1B9G160_9TREE|nr:hypothetical protein I302_06216 [Kwoniella bestiolae CBS 10118]OCF24755.1 hypothetical protein I302_06216 [Kwoniella bestiolae CBS 10118]
MSDKIKNVLLAGATGRLGQFILRSLLGEESLTVHVLTRMKSSSPGSVTHSIVSIQENSELESPSIPSTVPIHQTDYTRSSVSGIIHSNDIHAIVCALAPEPEAIKRQLDLIDASRQCSSVKLFVPSEFGFDTYNEKARGMVAGLVEPKWEVLGKLREAEKDGRMAWCAPMTGPFFDMATNDGEMGSLPFIGNAIVQIIKEKSTKPHLLAHQPTDIAEMNSTQNEILARLEEDTGTSWHIEQTTVEAERDKGLEALKDGKVLDAIQPLSFSVVWDGCGTDFLGRGKTLANEALGLPVPDLENGMSAANAWDRTCIIHLA